MKSETKMQTAWKKSEGLQQAASILSCLWNYNIASSKLRQLSANSRQFLVPHWSYSLQICFETMFSLNRTFLILKRKIAIFMLFNSTIVLISHHRLFQPFTLTLLKSVHDSQRSDPTKWQPGASCSAHLSSEILF